VWVVPGAGALAVLSLPDVVSECGRDFCRRIKSVRYRQASTCLGAFGCTNEGRPQGHGDVSVWRKAEHSISRNGGVTQCLCHAFRSDLPVLACHTRCAGIC
jgi:hypothetical protein